MSYNAETDPRQDDTRRETEQVSTTYRAGEQQRGGDAVHRVGGALSGVIEATGDIARTTISEIGNVAEELVETTGRFAQTTINEALGVIGSIVGSVMGGAARLSRSDNRGRTDQDRYQDRERYNQEQRDRQQQQEQTSSGAI